MTRFKNGPGSIAASSRPGNPSAGEAVFDPGAASFRYYTGTRWEGIPPVGIVEPYAGVATPTGWLLCDGSAVSRSTYADLFAVIDTIYGVGNNSTTFNLPDLRGRAIHGQDVMHGNAANRLTILNAAIGTAGGSQYLQVHTHNYAKSGNSGNDFPDHAHQWTLASAGNAQGTGDLPFRGHNYWDGGFRSGGTAWPGYGGGVGVRHTHTYSFYGNTDSVGSGGAHNVPPTRVLAFIIKH